MTARRTPDGQVYTEVPVVPRHDQLDGRGLGNSHPISAITGLQDALDSKADAVDGGNLVTDEEKALLGTVEEGAQENVIETVKVNGAALTPDGAKAVDVEVPTVYGRTIAYSGSSGKISLKGPTGSTISEAAIPRKGLSSLALDGDSKVLTATLQDGTSVTADLGAAADPYTAGTGLTLDDGEFSLDSQVQEDVESIVSHLSDQTAHVSSADRTAWNGIVSDAVKTSGNQTIAGAKTFTGAVVVPTPSSSSQAATKGYVDAAVAGGGAGAYTAGTGLALDGTEFSLSSATQATLSGSVQTSGDQTVAGVKTFSSLPVIPTTAPTDNGQAASKKYVDDSVSAKATDAAVVHNTGAETVAGLKTFSTIPKIPTDTPTDNAQVASKAYVDAAVAGGGGGGGGTAYTAGAGLSLVGTEFSLSSGSQSSLSAADSHVADTTIHVTSSDKTAWDGVATAAVRTAGAQTVGGVKTFTDSPIVPTPTADYEAATKKYVDDNAGGGGGSTGTMTVLGTSDYTTTMFSTLFTASGDGFTANKDVYIEAFVETTAMEPVFVPKGAWLPKYPTLSCTKYVSSSTGVFQIQLYLMLEGAFKRTGSNSGHAYSFTGMDATSIKATSNIWTVSNTLHSATPSGTSGKLTLYMAYR